MTKTDKKKNRKLRRRVRRTSALILLITAIIVAAIPVPENVAAPLSPADTNRQADKYEYEVTSADDMLDSVLFPGINLDSTGKTTYKAYAVFEFDGNWIYQWQYELYDSNSMSVIAGYNEKYVKGDVSIRNNMYSAYEVVTPAKLESFGNARVEGSTLTLSDPTTIDSIAMADSTSGKYWNGTRTVPNKTWLYLLETSSAFSDEYANYKTAYDDYVKANGTPVGFPSKTFDLSQFTTDDILKYYCETSMCTIPSYTGNTLSGCQLVPVLDEEDIDGDGSANVYIPQVVDADRVDSGLQVDDNTNTQGSKLGGFVCGDPTNSITAIANGVFKGVGNINSLSLPSNLKYIGDSAFEDSFIKSVSATSLIGIGNRAFKNCNALSTITLLQQNNTSLNNIGTEAFYGSAVNSFTIPCSVQEVGPGAFAECESLSTVSMADGAHSDCTIDKFAFYNCPSLSTVNWGEGATAVTEIGQAAFALLSGTGSMSSFHFPEGKAGNKLKLGQYILAGRGGLTEVYMPSTYWGRESAVEIPKYTFVNCYNLGYVDFTNGKTADPYACGRVSYDPALFAEVTNPDLYVRGPELNTAGDTAAPRKSTWAAETVVSDSVPYVYTKNGKDYYEISNDTYLLAIDSDGILRSCTFKDSSVKKLTDIIIPAKVGNINTTGIADGCFSQDDIKEYLTGVIFEDDSQIKTIEDGVFSDCPNLDTIVIGNTINSIGDNAFANCGTNISATSAVNVTFHTPKDGYTGFTMGKNAFTTGGKPLVFNGDVVKGYAPFDYAMDPTTYAKQETGLRICYKSLRPQNIIVIQDNDTGLATLVDYPHYEEMDTRNADYCKEMEKYYLGAYNGAEYDSYRKAYADAVAAGKTGTDLEEFDGPWNSDYYTRNPYSIRDLYEHEYKQSFRQLTPDGIAIVNSIFNIVVPAGVQSVDAIKYYNNATDNGVNITTYLVNEKSRYVAPGDGTEDVAPGLFSGWFDEDETLSAQRDAKKGNDYIQSVTLTDVTYLPDYAFDNCENLQSVVLGDAMEDIGTSPFRGCRNLTGVGGNDKFVGENGIIYSKNDDGTYTVEECLPSRGDAVGETTISPDYDSLIKQVSKIKEGAFEECNEIRQVYLSDATSLTTIPKRAFKNCKNLYEVYLPTSVKMIQEEAFATPKYPDKYTGVTIYGREVAIASDAFEHNKGVMIRSYEDSAAIEWAKYYDTSWETIGDTYKVTFLDYNGVMLGEPQHVTSGSSATPPENPTRTGYTFTGWSGSYEKIYQDTILIAQYKSGSGTNGSGNGTGGGTNGSNSSNSNSSSSSSSSDDDDDDDDDDNIHTVTVVNGLGSGRYKKGRTVTITANPAPEGQSFSYWSTGSKNVVIANAQNSTTTFTMPDNSVTVTANYKEGTGGSSVTYSTTASPVTVTGSGNGNGGGGASGGNGTGTGSGNGGQTTTTTTDQTPNTNAQVIITKPGISNTNLASATVEGSNDNFVVKITEDDSAEQAVRDALMKEFGSLDNIAYTAMDISLYDETGTVQIADASGLKVNITIPLPDSQVGYGGNNKAAGVVDGSLDKLDARYNTINGVDCISFTATHFSPYTVYVDTANLTAATDISPKTGDPIHPKWFLSLGLACLSALLFMKRDGKAGKGARAAI